MSAWTQWWSYHILVIRGQRSKSLIPYYYCEHCSLHFSQTFTERVRRRVWTDNFTGWCSSTSSRSLPWLLFSLSLSSLLSMSISLSVFQLYLFHIFVLPSISSSHASGKRLHYPGGLIKLQQLDAVGRFTVWFHPELSETEQDASWIDVLIPTTAKTIRLKQKEKRSFPQQKAF